jgi:hypothetical protein
MVLVKIIKLLTLYKDTLIDGTNLKTEIFHSGLINLTKNTVSIFKLPVSKINFTPRQSKAKNTFLRNISELSGMRPAGQTLIEFHNQQCTTLDDTKKETKLKALSLK